jgi:hypothetical protein
MDPADLPATTTTTTTNANVTVPKYVFIVPYRDREPHRVFFSTYIYKVMEDVAPEDWMFYFVHQNDKRPFNRGAMKNIGFLALKSLYPNDYKNIIFIFNDIDTLPYDKNVLNYHTDYGVIKHFYGFHFALGGIFSVRGVDFERINGFPNYWAWGGEDNLIHERAKQYGLVIDRSNFFTIGNMKILQFADGFKRLICRDELATSIMPHNLDGLSKLSNITHVIYDDTHMIDVSWFDTYIDYSQLRFEEQSLDKVSKIRVSPLNAIRNIKQLQQEYTVDVNKQVHPVHPVHPAPVRKIDRNGDNGTNTINAPIQPNLPFSMNMNMNPRNIGIIMPQDRHIVSEQERQNQVAAAAAAATFTSGGGRVYHNYKNHDMMIPLQRPNTNTNIGIHGHKQFGMRAMFM